MSGTLVTTQAADAFLNWHNGMPAMLAPQERARWLDNTKSIDPDGPLLAPVLKYNLRFYPVSKAVGRSTEKDPKLFEPINDSVVLMV